MSSLISQLKAWTPWGRPREPNRCLLLGMDTSGKTTLLYQWHLGAVVRTIPTIGFNVEDIKSDGKEVQCWDIGGCDMIAPLVQHYVTPGTAMLFLHPMNDSRVDFSLEIMRLHVAQIMAGGGRYFWVALTKQDLLDPETREGEVEKVRACYENELKQYGLGLVWKIFDNPGLCALDKDSFRPVLAEIAETMETNRGTYRTPDEEKKASGDREPKAEELIQQIKKDGERDLDTATFWSQFEKGSLERWDHRSHLRSGYLILLDCLQRMESVTEATDLFLEHLTRLRESAPHRFRNTQHRTMTMFWLYQLRDNLLNYRDSKKLKELPGPDDFQAVLLHNPHLMNSGIWKKHYTKGIMFSPFAREYWRLPDLQPLPGFPNPKSDTESAPNYNSKPRNRNERLPRFAFGIVQQYLTTGERRGAIIARALDALRSSTMRQRATDPSLPAYSETQAYFWIQLCHAACAGLAASESLTVSKLSFESFQALFNIDQDAWKQYYTPKVWDSAAARMEYVNSDLKPLPNIISSITPAQIRHAATTRASEPAINRVHDLPTLDTLVFQANLIRDSLATLPNPETNKITSHAHLLFNLYLRLTTHLSTRERLGTQMTAAISELSGANISSFTSRAFWIQQFTAAAIRMPRDALGKMNADREGFVEFLAANLHLAYAELLFVYYSRERWEAYEAQVAFVEPDLRALPRFIGEFAPGEERT